MSRGTAYGLYALLVLIWSSTWVAIKIGLEDAPALLGAGHPLRRRRRAAARVRGARRRPLKTDRLLALILGLLPFAFCYGLVYWGEQYIPSGLTAVLFGVMPLYTAILAALLLQDEPLRARLLAGVALALAGLALAFVESLELGSEDRAAIGAIAVVLSPLGAALGNVALKRRAAEPRRDRAQRLGDADRRRAAARAARRVARTGATRCGARRRSARSSTSRSSAPRWRS